MDEASRFDPGESEREVALVLLEASSLPRRLAGSRQWPSRLRSHEWQVLLVIALANTLDESEGAETPRGIASALALDLDDVHDALDALRDERLASISFRDPEVPDAAQEWSLTREGEAAALELVSFAGRALGWPPAPPSSLM